MTVLPIGKQCKFESETPPDSTTSNAAATRQELRGDFIHAANPRLLQDRGCGEESGEPYAEAQHQPVDRLEAEQSIALHDRRHHDHSC